MMVSVVVFVLVFGVVVLFFFGEFRDVFVVGEKLELVFFGVLVRIILFVVVVLLRKLFFVDDFLLFGFRVVKRELFLVALRVVSLQKVFFLRVFFV